MPPQTDGTQIREAKQGPNRKGIKPVVKEVQFYIEETRDFIIGIVTFFTPAMEVEDDSEVLLKDGNKEHQLLDLQEELKLLELELLPLIRENWEELHSPESFTELLHLITEYREEP